MFSEFFNTYQEADQFLTACAGSLEVAQQMDCEAEFLDAWSATSEADYDKRNEVAE